MNIHRILADLFIILRFSKRISAVWSRFLAPLRNSAGWTWIKIVFQELIGSADIYILRKFQMCAHYNSLF